MMTFAQLVDLLTQVFITPEVIGVTIVIALYINIVNYIVRYRKRVVLPKNKKTSKKVTTETPAKKTDHLDDDDAEEAASEAPVKKQKSAKKK